MSEFWEAYKDPRWQRKRLEVMEAAGFKCEQCGDSKGTLNVHHRHYKKGAKPWEYESDELVCLCVPCHDAFHLASTDLRTVAGQLDAGELSQLLSYARGLLLQHNHYTFEDDRTEFPITPDDEDGFSDAYGLYKHHSPALITWHLHNNKMPFQVTHKFMDWLLDRQRETFKVVEREDDSERFNDVDQILVGTTG